MGFDLLLAKKAVFDVEKDASCWSIVFALMRHFKEVVDIHRLVNIEEECRTFQGTEGANLCILEPTALTDVGLVTLTVHGHFNVENWFAVIVLHNGVAIDVLCLFEQRDRNFVSISGVFVPGTYHVVSYGVAVEPEAVEVILGEG